MINLTKKRLSHKIDGLRAEAAKLSHERDLLRPLLLQAQADKDADTFAELAERIRVLTKQVRSDRS